MLQSIEGLPISLGQLCYSYCNNLRFYGVLCYSEEAGGLVIHNLGSGIEFLVQSLDNLHIFTGIELLHIPNE